ncbi:hypothetical protein L3X38_010540 [Prunus dulcis]|uniref:Uncharacterized protein n=1 Tax=Prunus dulcis TaxID=3755 RepID=A0AAD4WHC0_PRUDU|nr:hypothetical protein L3X38_010540 [Prunus dulcis]
MLTTWGKLKRETTVKRGLGAFSFWQLQMRLGYCKEQKVRAAHVLKYGWQRAGYGPGMIIPSPSPLPIPVPVPVPAPIPSLSFSGTSRPLRLQEVPPIPAPIPGFHI